MTESNKTAILESLDVIVAMATHAPQFAKARIVKHADYIRQVLREE